mgnify:FL=1
MKNYDFDVQFTVSIKAESYEQAVRIAAETFPDVHGKTMFIVDTDDYGFLPNQETIDKMHEDKECSCHNPNVVNIDDYYEEN